MPDISQMYHPDDKPSEGFQALPDGDYPVIITSTEMKPTKARDGAYLQIEMQVVDGQHKGSKIIDRLNLQNPNQQAVDIARGTLAAIRKATGVTNPQMSEQLHNIPMIAKVVKVARNDKPGEFSNDVKKYSAAGGQQAQPQASPPYQPPVATPVQTQTAPPQNAASPSGPVWGGQQ